MRTASEWQKFQLVVQFCIQNTLLSTTPDPQAPGEREREKSPCSANTLTKVVDDELYNFLLLLRSFTYHFVVVVVVVVVFVLSFASLLFCFGDVVAVVALITARKNHTDISCLSAPWAWSVFDEELKLEEEQRWWGASLAKTLAALRLSRTPGDRQSLAYCRPWSEVDVNSCFLM